MKGFNENSLNLNKIQTKIYLGWIMLVYLSCTYLEEIMLVYLLYIPRGDNAGISLVHT